MSYAPGGGTHSRVGGSVQQQDRPLSPSRSPPQHHDLTRKSQSFSYGSHNKIGTMSPNGPLSPTTRGNNFFKFTDAGSLPLPHEMPQFDNTRANSCNQQHLLHTQSKTSQPTQRKKTPPPSSLLDTQNLLQLPQQQKDPLKGFYSLRRRPASSTPKESRPTEEEKNKLNSESSKGSQSSNTGGTTWSHLMARLQGRSLTPSPHRTAALPVSPKTYRRERHPSDTPQTSGFRRYGSLPMQKTQPAPNADVYLQPRVVSDLAAVRERLSRSSSVRLPRARVVDGRDGDDRSTTPWRDKGFIPPPVSQKSHSERNSTLRRQQQLTGGTSDVKTTTNSDTLMKSWPKSTSPTTVTSTSVVLSQVQNCDSQAEEQTGSHFTSITRDRYLGQRSQSFVSDSSQDPMVIIFQYFVYTVIILRAKSQSRVS